MTERVHLDSRRLEDENAGGRKYSDYLLRLNDQEAVECSPFRSSLIALGRLGITQILIYHPSKESSLENDKTRLILHAYNKIPGSESMVARHLAGEITITATITADGERESDFTFGEGADIECDATNLNETIWDHLESMHRSLTEGGEGRNLPIVDFPHSVDVAGGH